MTSRHGRKLRILRVSRISKQCYSNGEKIIPFCRSRRAQRNDIFANSVPMRIKKLRAIKILDIFAWVHYMNAVIAVPQTSESIVLSSASEEENEAPEMWAGSV